jgi:hypothetical protein
MNQILYNFVIFGSDWDLYKSSYSDVIKLKNVRYISNPYYFRSSISKLLYRIHWSPIINKFFKLPFKWIWNTGYYKFDFDDDKPICFLFFSNWCEYEKHGLLTSLKKSYPHSKFVCYFQDLIELKSEIDINNIKNTYDLVISFDQRESKMYDLYYHQLVFSNCFPKEEKNSLSSDIYFLGKAKNRLPEIIKTFEYLKELNLKCNFYLVDVNPCDQIYPGEINYIDNMSYMENLKHVASAKCLLEIMQRGGHGYTQRMCEAIAFDKKIITNNPEIKYAPFYDKTNILFINDPKCIKYESLFFENFDRDADHLFKSNLSPLRLLEFISSNLQSTKDNIV